MAPPPHPAALPPCLPVTSEQRQQWPAAGLQFLAATSHPQSAAALDTDLFIIWTGGTGAGTLSLLSCLLLARGLIRQMEKPMAD